MATSAAKVKRQAKILVKNEKSLDFSPTHYFTTGHNYDVGKKTYFWREAHLRIDRNLPIKSIWLLSIFLISSSLSLFLFCVFVFFIFRCFTTLFGAFPFFFFPISRNSRKNHAILKKELLEKYSRTDFLQKDNNLYSREQPIESKREESLIFRYFRYFTV